MGLFGDLLSLPLKVAGGALTGAGEVVKEAVKPVEKLVEDVKEKLSE